MPTYTHDHVVVYGELAGVLRLAKSVRVFVTDTVAGTPVSVTQGAVTATYADSDAHGRVTFTTTVPNRLRLTNGATFVDVWPIEVTGPTDASVATLLGTASATRTAADARYLQSAGARTALSINNVDNTSDLGKPVSTATAAAIAALQASAASVDDLFVSQVLIPRGVTALSGVSASYPMLVCPFPLRVTSISLIHWDVGATIATSDTNYWVVDARNSVGNTPTVFATKTTRTTVAGPIPAGVAWDHRIPWTFNTTLFTAAKDFAAGSTLNIAFTPTGSPTALLGVQATVGYTPL